MSLLEQEKSNVIRHLGYPVVGLWMVAPGGQSMAYGGAGFRYFGAFGSLLYRLNQLKPDEESRITGRAYGAVGFTGVNPTPGDTVSVTLSGGGLASPVTVSVTVPQNIPGQSPYTQNNLVASLAQALTLVPQVMGAGFTVLAPYGSGPFTQQSVAVPIVALIGPPCMSFSLTASYAGNTVPQIMANGQLLPPFISFRSMGQNNKIYGYLPILDYLDGAYGGATIDLSASIANNVTLRHDELEQREAQYQRYRRSLSEFMGVPINPDAINRGGNEICFT